MNIAARIRSHDSGRGAASCSKRVKSARRSWFIGSSRRVSTASNSFWDGYAFCNPPAQLYIGGFYRTPSNANSTATVTATVPLALTDTTGDTIPFSQISWTSAGNGDGNAAQPFPDGTFPAGGSLTVGTITRNQWAESCWTFSYRNTVIPPGGSYTGRVTYTLVAP